MSKSSNQSAFDIVANALENAGVNVAESGDDLVITVNRRKFRVTVGEGKAKKPDGKVFVLVTNEKAVGTDFPPSAGVGVFREKATADLCQRTFLASAKNGISRSAQVVKADLL